MKKVICHRLIIICLLLLPEIIALAQDTSVLKAVFQDFQYGYNKRDTSAVESFGNQLFSRDIFVLGTGYNEWVSGLSSAKKLIKNDWTYWLNLSIDTSNLKFERAGNVYLFVVPGTAFIQFPNKEAAYGYGMRQIEGILKNESDNRLKLLAISKESSSLINEIEQGDLNIKYQIRLTGALIKQDGRWVFQQIVYSFPYPMKRQ